jgi:hypothetical protein
VPEALAFLSRAPYDNVYIYSLIEARTGPMYVARDPDGRIRGIGYDGPNLVFAVGKPEDVDPFVASSLGGRSTRMIVGPRPAVERFWKNAKGRFARPSAVRESQPVYALLPERFVSRKERPTVDVGVATLDELDELALQSARMAAGEFGAAPPARVDPGFRGRTAQTISSGRFWRARRNGRLIFQCYVGGISPQTAQIQGVWAPPDARGNGDATYAFSVICKKLLREHASLSLYVNGFNERAIALYERVGYTRVSEFASVLF